MHNGSYMIKVNKRDYKCKDMRFTFYWWNSHWSRLEERTRYSFCCYFLCIKSVLMAQEVFWLTWHKLVFALSFWKNIVFSFFEIFSWICLISKLVQEYIYPTHSANSIWLNLIYFFLFNHKWKYIQYYSAKYFGIVALSITIFMWSGSNISTSSQTTPRFFIHF